MNHSSSQIHDRLINLLLSAMYHRRVHGITSSFLYGRPGAREWERRLGTTVSYGHGSLVRAALFARQHGAPHLRYISVDEIESMLIGFMSDNYWYISNDVFGQDFDDSYDHHVSTAARANLANALADSNLFRPLSDLTLFPLVTVQVDAEFDATNFFLIRAASLDHSRLPSASAKEPIAAEVFPPIADWKWKKHSPNAWLGVRSPAYQASNKMKSAILGALALTPPAQYRYLFSMREVFGGRCTIGKTVTTSFGAAHTPPMAHNIPITSADHPWLSIVADKLAGIDKPTRRQLRALEYFYRAWPLSAPDRFPILCMALDALFGEVTHAAQAVIDKARQLLGAHVSDGRFRHLMDVRASVIHGGAPDVYDSRKYARYYSRYETDPIRDMELIVAECMRADIFRGALQEHVAPDADLIAEMRAKGQIPDPTIDRSILGAAPRKLPI